ncbi:MAG: sigma-54-dependent Fis family transcriptional regulator [Spirochaetaceae bacterium]|nr:MAG: sigma-54-dependent Fis family transcriptional regulator [Spirochaetaceae bacterium]
MRYLPKVAICDTNEVIGSELPYLLEEYFSVIPVAEPFNLPTVLQKSSPDVVLLGVPGNALAIAVTSSVLSECGTHSGSPRVIALSPSLVPDLVVKLMRMGVHDCVFLPATPEKVVAHVHAALPLGPVHSTPSRPEPGPLGAIVGLSDASVELRRVIQRYSRSDSPVLLLGESGTGKDLSARALHELSHRSAGPFHAQNCGAIPDSLADSELFGSERGAYTDAVSRPGLFEIANRGTLFLDEIGEMSLLTQAKLLRVLEEGQVRRVGATRSRTVDVRVVAATNRDLAAEVKAGKFRNDLYHRLTVLVHRIVPLRERVEDIPLLSDRILQTLYETALNRARNGHAPRRRYLSEEALRFLMQQNWPGNVREVMNVLERSIQHSDRVKLLASDIRLLH